MPSVRGLGLGDPNWASVFLLQLTFSGGRTQTQHPEAPRRSERPAGTDCVRRAALGWSLPRSASGTGLRTAQRVESHLGKSLTRQSLSGSLSALWPCAQQGTGVALSSAEHQGSWAATGQGCEGSGVYPCGGLLRGVGG